MLTRLAAIVWASLLLSVPAFGEGAAAEPAAADEWQIMVTPVIWGLALHGNVDAKGHSADVSASFFDILKDLNAGLMGAVEARNDRFLVLFAGLGAWLGDDVNGKGRTVAVPSVPLVNATIGPSQADVKVTLAILDLKLGWRLLSVPTTSLFVYPPEHEDARRTSLDLLVGARYWYVKNELDLKVPVTLSVGLPPGTPLPPGLGNLELPSLTTDGIKRDIDASSDWVDPVVGARGTVDLTERLSFSLLGDVGGFDLGSASKFSWKANALLTWKLSERWALVAGYQGLNVQREKGDAEVDLTLYGPVVGLGFQF